MENGSMIIVTFSNASQCSNVHRSVDKCKQKQIIVISHTQYSKTACCIGKIKEELSAMNISPEQL